MVLLGRLLLATALLGTIGSTLRAYPHQLAYFNELAGGPYEGWRHLLGSSVDWGQDLTSGRFNTRFSVDGPVGVLGEIAVPAYLAKGCDAASCQRRVTRGCRIVRYMMVMTLQLGAASAAAPTPNPPSREPSGEAILDVVRAEHALWQHTFEDLSIACAIRETRETHQIDGAPPLMASRWINVCSQRGRRRVELLKVPDTGVRTVYVSGDSYAFEVDRNGPKRGYQISDFSHSKSEDSHVIEGVRYYVAMTMAPIMIEEERFIDLIAPESAWKVVSVNEVSQDESTRVVVDLKRPRGEVTDVMRVFLAPEAHFAVVSWEADYSTQRRRGAVSYYADAPISPFPEEVRWELMSGDGVSRSVTHLAFETPTECDAGEREFSLEAFGLPEVASGSQSNWKMLAFVLVNVLVLLVGVGYFIATRTAAARGK